MSEQKTESDDLVKRAIRTLLPGLRVANYVERWSPQSPAVRALGILSEYVDQGPIEAGDLIDPQVPTAHPCRPAGMSTPSGTPTTDGGEDIGDELMRRALSTWGQGDPA